MTTRARCAGRDSAYFGFPKLLGVVGGLSVRVGLCCKAGGVGSGIGLQGVVPLHGLARGCQHLQLGLTGLPTPAERITGTSNASHGSDKRNNENDHDSLVGVPVARAGAAGRTLGDRTPIAVSLAVLAIQTVNPMPGTVLPAVLSTLACTDARAPRVAAFAVFAAVPSTFFARTRAREPRVALFAVLAAMFAAMFGERCQAIRVSARCGWMTR